MTKIITAVIIIAALYGGWHLFLYWEKVKNEEEVQKKENAQAAIAGDSLPGLPYQLEASLQTARQQGAAAMGTWLKNNSASLQDPRKAWIELDYVLLLARENPSEAKRTYQSVRERLKESSPVWKRVVELEKTFGP
jgi:hypothetical protein